MFVYFLFSEQDVAIISSTAILLIPLAIALPIVCSHVVYHRVLTDNDVLILLSLEICTRARGIRVKRQTMIRLCSDKTIAR